MGAAFLPAAASNYGDQRQRDEHTFCSNRSPEALELRNDVNKNRTGKKTKELGKLCLGFRCNTVEYVIH